MSVAADLDRHRYVSLATFRTTGAEVRTPVWFAAVGGKLYVFTAGESGKVKRLRRSSRARDRRRQAMVSCRYDLARR